MPNAKTVTRYLHEARKAIGALVAGEAAAVEAGLIGGELAGWITGALGVASAVIVYLLRNEKSAKSGRT